MSKAIFLVIISLSHSLLFGFSLYSHDFQSGHLLPKKYVCQKYGANVTPQFYWRYPPKNTRSYVLFVEDLDAHYAKQPITRVDAHWVVFIPAKRQHLPHDLMHNPAVYKQVLMTQNIKGHFDYHGPCPTDSRYHRYLFSLVALNQSLHGFQKKGLKPTLSRDTVLQMIAPHVLATAHMTALFRHSLKKVPTQIKDALPKKNVTKRPKTPRPHHQ